ncbi:hypothetical protein CG428_21575 [Pantoea ananatis]|uniref:hypothetical protein n=1 Tax=Pantoea ananas TaxID=553 RepID=UPI000CF4286B|nr:hypothetical protein [Pantoea ananatis]PQK69529.1 hypothetical protein CG428_21575 [Pantoea ananatis]
MGMFDTVTFRYRMPDGETGPDYQTIELECECASYQISADGRLLKWQTDAGGFADTGFDGSFTLTGRAGYRLYFERGTLAWIEVYSQDDRRWPFEPTRYMTEQV